MLVRALILAGLLAGCSGPLKLLTGGGPNVAANVQAGQTNSQTLGTTELRETRQSVRQAHTVTQSADENQVKTERVEMIVQNQGPNPWWIVALIVALFLDSPMRWPEQIMNSFRRGDK